MIRKKSEHQLTTLINLVSCVAEEEEMERYSIRQFFRGGKVYSKNKGQASRELTLSFSSRAEELFSSSNKLTD